MERGSILEFVVVSSDHFWLWMFHKWNYGMVVGSIVTTLLLLLILTPLLFLLYSAFTLPLLCLSSLRSLSVCAPSRLLLVFPYSFGAALTSANPVTRSRSYPSHTLPPSEKPPPTLLVSYGIPVMFSSPIHFIHPKPITKKYNPKPTI